jgi:Xaa-Pro aminopeptidase
MVESASPRGGEPRADLRVLPHFRRDKPQPGTLRIKSGARAILSLDSGGNFKGYIGDVCRMAIQGEPDAELVDLLAEIDEIQMAARKPIRAGAPGSDIYASADQLLRRSPSGNLLEFVAHGMGLISHEAPRGRGWNRGGVQRSARLFRRVISILSGAQPIRTALVRLPQSAKPNSGWPRRPARSTAQCGRTRLPPPSG